MSDTRVPYKPYIVGGASTSFVVPSGGGGGNNTALDGAVLGAAGTDTIIVSLTTTQPNDVIIAISNQFSGGIITSISSANVIWDVAAYTFFSGTNPNCRMTIWRGVAANPLVAESITITHAGAGTKNVIVFGVSGAQTASSAATFDSGGPTTTNGNIAGTITTANANDFIVEVYQNENATQTESTGYTHVIPTVGLIFIFAQYKIVTGTGTYSSGTLAGGDTIDGGIAFAIKSL